MCHCFKNEIRRPTHDCQEKQDEQRINNSIFFCAQLKRLPRQRTENGPKLKLERDETLNLCPLTQLSRLISHSAPQKKYGALIRAPFFHVQSKTAEQPGTLPAISPGQTETSHFDFARITFRQR
jgi:hypothetical protein